MHGFQQHPPIPDDQQQHPPAKRHRQLSPDHETASTSSYAEQPHPPEAPAGEAKPGHSHSNSSSGFRNVSACNRCRVRKNRCDQKLPCCASCSKAGVACVGYDPITKKEIPRSYVYYLESRVQQLEGLLNSNNITFPPADDLDYCAKADVEGRSARSPTSTVRSRQSEGLEAAINYGHQPAATDAALASNGTALKQSGPLAPASTAGSRHLGSSSGLSFARVVFAAVQKSVADQRTSASDSGVTEPRTEPPVEEAGVAGPGTSMRDSFFGLHTKPSINPAPFPHKDLGRRLVTFFFEHANPQIPILHRLEFMNMFDQAYLAERPVRGPRELYMLNMVFAIGGAIVMTDPGKAEGGEKSQRQPEEYHASAIMHLEACLGNSGSGLEELQAVLLLANFALLRPIPPGLWYIVGVAVRLAIDLGLHYEDGQDLDAGLATARGQNGERELGRRQYIRDLRRRLWWCTYSFDRLVSVCVGRPCGVSDQAITTDFPSLLEDRYITPAGFLRPNDTAPQTEPTYKLVAHHYFRLRLLQSEILQVLQYQQVQNSRLAAQMSRNPFMHTQLPSPFLSRFSSFRAWRIDIDKRLYEWKSAAPTREATGVGFTPDFLDLNYWQAVIMLYRQSLSVPAMFEGEYHTSKEVNSPASYQAELGDDEERVYLKVAEAGQKILRLYRQLHLLGLVNYTYLATHHLFMAGISYLYAIWHSPIVRSRLSMDEVDFTILAATSVFTDLISKCPPAEACRDAFDRTAKATIKMANSTGGFGQVMPQPGQNEGRQSWGGTPYGGTPQRIQRTHADRLAALSSSSPIAELFPRTSVPPTLSPLGLQYSSSLGTSDGENARAAFPYAAGPGPGTGQNSPRGGGGGDIAPNDISVLPSPTTLLQHPNSVSPSVGSPASIAQQQQQQQQGFPTGGGLSGVGFAPQPPFTPGNRLNLANLQGTDFLQSLAQASSPGGVQSASGDGTLTPQMDANFGLGWEGFHHDYNEGAQTDLFDGFFFGGPPGMNNGS